MEEILVNHSNNTYNINISSLEPRIRKFKQKFDISQSMMIVPESQMIKE